MNLTLALVAAINNYQSPPHTVSNGFSFAVFVTTFLLRWLSINNSLIISSLTLLVLFGTAWIAYSANKLAISTKGSDVIRLFFDVAKELPLNKSRKLTNHEKEYICNYFDYVCLCLKEGYLNTAQKEMIEPSMKTGVFYNFMMQQRRKYSNSFENYYAWSLKNMPKLK